MLGDVRGSGHYPPPPGRTSGRDVINKALERIWAVAKPANHMSRCWRRGRVVGTHAGQPGTGRRKVRHSHSVSSSRMNSHSGQ